MHYCVFHSCYNNTITYLFGLLERGKKIKTSKYTHELHVKCSKEQIQELNEERLWPEHLSTSTTLK